jgi:ABC-type antimicrobial peptide transport system permease subunit/AraC-like DNA-binding protein
LAVQLWCAKKPNRSANLFLALALTTTVLWMILILGIDIGPDNYFIHWSRLPLLYMLVAGPFIYFYVLKLTCQEYKIGHRYLLHFSPLVLALSAQILLNQFDSILQLSASIIAVIYLWAANRLIDKYYRRLKFNEASDRYRYELRWLRRILISMGLSWLLWVPFTLINYFFYHNQLGVKACYPLYLLSAVVMIRIAAAAFSRLNNEVPADAQTFKPLLPAELKQKGIWLKEVMQAHLYYRDSDLSLRSLAQTLNINQNELSRIINSALGKNFNDFINAYRVSDVVQKMQDPAYDRLTLIGIALNAGFNSKSTFNRIFKEMTGLSPAEYKRALEKERPTYTLRPFIRPAALVLRHKTAPSWSYTKLTHSFMFKNYLKIAWRNLITKKFTSFINIGGLALGMSVSLIIGLWIWSELSFDRSIPNYDRIAMVLQNHTRNNQTETWNTQAYPTGQALRSNYGSDFKQVVMASGTWPHVLSFGENNLKQNGNFMEPGITEMLSLQMAEGSRAGLNDPSSILLSRSAVLAIFGKGEAMNKTLRIDHDLTVKVAGVYEDLPSNSYFADLKFIAPWSLLVQSQHYDTRFTNPWGSSMFQTFVQLADGADMSAVSQKIRDVKLNAIRNSKTADVHSNPVVFLQPMARWHLYSEFKNGVNSGGRIQYVWLFGIIGAFVLLLACINFMNLSTARSEKRAMEVGIRKAIGSLRGQLIIQFYTESLVTALLAFLLGLALVLLSLPFFNGIAGKQLGIPGTNIYFWLCSISFCVFTAIIAGSYPAIYLSSFQPVKVLKGTFRTGRLAMLPRKMLVVLQFTASVMLIIGTIVIFRQVEFAKDRPVGYSRNGLITIPLQTDEINRQYQAVRNDLIGSGMVSAIAESETPITQTYVTQSGLDWRGKSPALQEEFTSVAITPEFGKTIGWKVERGRDLSSTFLSDSSSFIINETAAAYMGLKEPVGETIRWKGNGNYTIVGIVKDMVTGSPYDQAKPMFFYLRKGHLSNMLLRINPSVSAHTALIKIAAIFKAYDATSPFSYNFVSEDFAKNFDNEERVGKLASCFSFLAILISCLGLFGMASFMAEQRKKEIGVRKVLGATVPALWAMLSKDFIRLVFISLLIAMPLSYLFMEQWLQHYNYRTAFSWWIFLLTAAGTISVALLTVSYQTIQAALANPGKSLKAD